MILRFVVVVFFPIILFAQEEKQSIYAYYKNGNVQTKIQQITINTLEVLDYYPNGQLKDSMRYTHDNGVGIRKIYRKNGSLKYVIDYGFELNKLSISKMYRSDGSLKTIGGYRDSKAYELLKVYNRKGIYIKQYDMNKGKVVKVPATFKRGKHLRGKSESSKFNKRYLLIADSTHTIKLRPGDLVTVKLKDEATIYNHCQVEGFRDNLITFSTFEYDRSKSEHSLKYIKSWRIATDKISWITYPQKINSRFKFISELSSSLSGQ